jgi:polysaccharide biosynthesis transport protein
MTAVVVGFVTVTGIVSLVLPRSYQAVGRISVDKERGNALGLNDFASGDTADRDDLLTLDTQVDVLQAEALALETIHKLHLQDNPTFTGPGKSNESVLLLKLQRSMEVSRLPRSRIIEVRFAGADPKLTADVVNTLMEVYLNQNFRTKAEYTSTTSKWLSGQLSDLKSKVEQSQEALVQYQREHGILGTDEKENIVTVKLDQINRDLTAAEVDRIQKEAAYRFTQTGSPELIASADTSALIQKLRSQEFDLRTQYAQATANLGPIHPRVLELENQLKQITVTEQAENDRIAGRYRSEYAAAVQREQMLRRVLEEQKAEANKLNESAIQYSILKHEVEANRQLYDSLLEKLREAGVSAGLRSTNIRVLDPARVPNKPASPNTPQNLGVAFVMSTIVAVGLALFLEKDRVQRIIVSPEQAENVIGLRLGGVIPLLKNGNRGHSRQLPSLVAPSSYSSIALCSYLRPHSAAAECYRALRTAVLLNAPKLILVTSALRMEGKTSTCVNLATVLAQAGRRVLLVDADLRRPGLQSALGVLDSAPSGLSTVLEGEQDADTALVRILELANAFAIFTGPQASQPSELLGSHRMRDLLLRWREEFDYIVVDSPPVLSVTDSVILAGYSDTVLLVVRLGQTPVKALAEARDLLFPSRTSDVVVVGNALDMSAANYYCYGSSYAAKYYDERSRHAS